MRKGFLLPRSPRALQRTAGASCGDLHSACIACGADGATDTARKVVQREKQRSDVAQLAATSPRPSTQTPALACHVFLVHGSRLAIMLRDWSVLYLCRDQDRREARLQRVLDILDQTYSWTKPLDIRISEAPAAEFYTPRSASILRQFPLLMELCFDTESKNSEALFSERWNSMFECMWAGLEAFADEGCNEWQPEWWNWYYDENFLKVLDSQVHLKAYASRCGWSGTVPNIDEYLRVGYSALLAGGGDTPASDA